MSEVIVAEKSPESIRERVFRAHMLQVNGQHFLL